MTLSLTTNFLASAREGELFGTARRTGGGHKLFYAEALIEDAEGRAIASAMGTFKYGPRTGG
jgi:acyl-coenzyme A thioesterase PaaI-like protein